MMRPDEMADASPRTASPPVRWRGSALVSCSPALLCTGLRPRCGGPGCRCLARTNDYFFCSVVVTPSRAFRRSSRPVRRS
jgi:hypothetical protein